MFVLRAKVSVTDETPGIARFGVGGPRAADSVEAALGIAVPRGGYAVGPEGARVAHVPDGRLVIVAPVGAADAIRARLAAHATPAAREVWDWLAIHAGVPMVTAATQDLFVAQTANQDALGGLDFRKGCYPGQEIVARTQYLGRLKERLFILATEAAPPAPATRLYAPVYGDQACGTVVNSAPAPEGGSLLLGVLQTEAAGGALSLGAPDGPAAHPQPLPYALPEPAQPRGRVRM
jgi:folate-binding protein YgfZ